MTPLNWDARLEHIIDAHAEASKHEFICHEERELFINSLINKRKNPFSAEKYNVVFCKLTPIVVDGKVKRSHNK